MTQSLKLNTALIAKFVQILLKDIVVLPYSASLMSASRPNALKAAINSINSVIDDYLTLYYTFALLNAISTGSTHVLSLLDARKRGGYLYQWAAWFHWLEDDQAPESFVATTAALAGTFTLLILFQSRRIGWERKKMRLMEQQEEMPWSRSPISESGAPPSSSKTPPLMSTRVDGPPLRTVLSCNDIGKLSKANATAPSLLSESWPTSNGGIQSRENTPTNSEQHPLLSLQGNPIELAKTKSWGDRILDVTQFISVASVVTMTVFSIHSALIRGSEKDDALWWVIAGIMGLARAITTIRYAFDGFSLQFRRVFNRKNACKHWFAYCPCFFYAVGAALNGYYGLRLKAPMWLAAASSANALFVLFTTRANKFILAEDQISPPIRQTFLCNHPKKSVRCCAFSNYVITTIEVLIQWLIINPNYFIHLVLDIKCGNDAMDGTCDLTNSEIKWSNAIGIALIGTCFVLVNTIRFNGWNMIKDYKELHQPKFHALLHL